MAPTTSEAEPQVQQPTMTKTYEGLCLEVRKGKDESYVHLALGAGVQTYTRSAFLELCKVMFPLLKGMSTREEASYFIHPSYRVFIMPRQPTGDGGSSEWVVRILQLNDLKHPIQGHQIEFTRDHLIQLNRWLVDICDTLGIEVSPLYEQRRRSSKKVTVEQAGDPLGARMPVYVWQIKCGEVRRNSERVFIDYDQCRRDAHMMADFAELEVPGEMAVIDISKNYTLPPTEQYVAYHFYLYAMEHEALKMATRHCIGCQHKSPSQKNHLDGCLADRSKKIDLHYTRVKAVLSRQLLAQALLYILGKLDLDVSRALVLTDSVLYFTCDDQSYQDMVNEVTPPMYVTLFAYIYEEVLGQSLEESEEEEEEDTSSSTLSLE